MRFTPDVESLKRLFQKPCGRQDLQVEREVLDGEKIPVSGYEAFGPCGETAFQHHVIFRISAHRYPFPRINHPRNRDHGRNPGNQSTELVEVEFSACQKDRRNITVFLKQLGGHTNLKFRECLDDSGLRRAAEREGGHQHTGVEDEATFSSRRPCSGRS